jgi:hypothetical protein
MEEEINGTLTSRKSVIELLWTIMQYNHFCQVPALFRDPGQNNLCLFAKTFAKSPEVKRSAP